MLTLPTNPQTRGDSPEQEQQNSPVLTQMNKLSLNVAPSQAAVGKLLLASGLAIAEAFTRTPEEIERARREEEERRKQEEAKKAEEAAKLLREQRELELILAARGKDPTKEIEKGNRSLFPSLTELKEERFKLERKKQDETFQS